VRNVLLTAVAVLGLSTGALAQAQVDMELMTYPEIAAAMRAGKTTVLIYNGGTEQRGPHAVLGGHTLIARRASVEIARRLGNALVAPVLPFSIAGSHLNPAWPGSVNLPGPIFTAVNEAVADSMVVNGFKTIILMGDHGGGQAELESLAKKLDQKYAPKGTHVYYCGDVYYKSTAESAAWIKAHNLPPTTHGGLRDTSTLMYLGGDAYVRKDKLVAGDPVLPEGQKPDPGKPRVNNGVTGDPRPSTPEIGKLFFEMQVNDAVAQIQKLTAGARR
jgi:creatinine amidohydrolase/Fe(II)-dependent formamide hydrolase-like protein